ncbi:MAG: cysteine--tRNA ligase [Gracilibacteraceae bacterium]|nr:cysteine--tRNA ligase [Gracilibacteraceae bacterium]
MRLYNTMTRRKEEFVPREPGKAAIYACGPTVYNYFHLGNARMLVVFDMIRRYLAWRGFEVNYVQNFTDIDDKIIARAREEGCDTEALAAKYIEAYFADAAALRVQKAAAHPKATENIAEMLDIIRVLIEKGLAYAAEGDVYYAVDRFAGYGKLSGRTPDDMTAGARVDPNPRKRGPMDFALWKKAKEGEPFWPSPWGEGRPGWHIECSAMALKYLGPSFDIHGGGGDLIFPHHENEIAQTEGYLDGKAMARYWMHNAFITVDQEKMSKSEGNFFLVRDLLKKWSGDVVRFYLLGTHYRSPLDFDEEKLVMAAKGLERLKTAWRLAEEAALRPVAAKTELSAAAGPSFGEAAAAARRAFTEAMDDDFNSAQAYAALFDLARDINTAVAAGDAHPAALREAAAALRELAAVLGLVIAPEEAARADGEKFAALMALIIDIRAAARAKKDWPTADMIRDRLKEAGLVIEDTPQGARWYPAP